MGTFHTHNDFYTAQTVFLQLNPTPHRILTAFSFCMIYKPFEIWGHGVMCKYIRTEEWKLLT